MFKHVDPTEVESATAHLRRIGVGRVIPHIAPAETLLQINSDRDDVEQLVREVLPSAVLLSTRDNPG